MKQGSTMRYVAAAAVVVAVLASAEAPAQFLSPGGSSGGANESSVGGSKELLNNLSKGITLNPAAQVPKTSQGDVVPGLREALRLGATRAIGQVGKADGFLKDRDVHIPLPDMLAKAKAGLAMVGAAQLADDLELRLNRAAEEATPRARDILWKAVTDMKIEDAESILHGPEDAATSYFRRATSTSLNDAFRPVVQRSLQSAGAVAAFDQVTARYQTLPLMPDLKTNLVDYAMEKTLDGLFFYIAREEAAIRHDPAQRTTDLLKRVFLNAS